MMRTRRPRAIPFVAATLAVALASGCSGSTDGEQDQANAKPASSAPPPTGVGPYPTPSDVDTSPTPAREPSKAPAQPHGGIPSPESVDQRDAAAVSKGALTAMLTYDTATDASRTEASRRMVAAGWCTAAYGAKAKAAWVSVRLRCQLDDLDLPPGVHHRRSHLSRPGRPPRGHRDNGVPAVGGRHHPARPRQVDRAAGELHGVRRAGPFREGRIVAPELPLSPVGNAT